VLQCFGANHKLATPISYNPPAKILGIRFRRATVTRITQTLPVTHLYLSYCLGNVVFWICAGFRDRALLHPNSTKAPPTLPVICRLPLPTIIFCFIIVIICICAAGTTIFRMVVFRTRLYPDFVNLYTLGTTIGGIEAVCITRHIGLLLAVGLLGAVEGKHANKLHK
ncbi:hypothetical protein BKA70DRAFT_1326864, partial [Coprinopsis sp. MPI-PUGE-AT-0042]